MCAFLVCSQTYYWDNSSVGPGIMYVNSQESSSADSHSPLLHAWMDGWEQATTVGKLLFPH